MKSFQIGSAAICALGVIVLSIMLIEGPLKGLLALVLLRMVAGFVVLILAVWLICYIHDRLWERKRKKKD